MEIRKHNDDEFVRVIKNFCEKEVSMSDYSVKIKFELKRFFCNCDDFAYKLVITVPLGNNSKQSFYIDGYTMDICNIRCLQDGKLNFRVRRKVINGDRVDTYIFQDGVHFIVINNKNFYLYSGFGKSNDFPYYKDEFHKISNYLNYILCLISNKLFMHEDLSEKIYLLSKNDYMV